MTENHTGYLAKSLAGHDKEKIYVIIREDKEYVYLSDGKYHTLDKLKKKNKKHIQYIKRICNQAVGKNLNELFDHEIKRIIKLYKTECE